MNNSLSEFQDLISFYREAAATLTNKLSVIDASDAGALAEFVLKNRDCLARIDEMSDRVSRLCDSWKDIELQLDQESRNQTQAAMAAAKAEAIKLNDVCRMHSQILEAVRNRLGEQLECIGKRNLHLKSIKPVQHNFPKFIDSRC
jgi:hypothetical protein